MSMKRLVEIADFDGIGIYHVGASLWNFPVVTFNRERLPQEPIAYTRDDCEIRKFIVSQALPQYEIVSTWNGEGYTRFSVSMKPRENGQ